MRPAVMGSRMVASFKNIGDGRSLEIEVTGDWRDKKAEMRVVETKQVIATVSRDYFKMREIFAGQQTYYVQVCASQFRPRLPCLRRLTCL